MDEEYRSDLQETVEALVSSRIAVLEYNPYHSPSDGKFANRGGGRGMSQGAAQGKLDKHGRDWKNGAKKAGKLVLKAAVGVAVGVAVAHGAGFLMAKFAPTIIAKTIVPATKLIGNLVGRGYNPMPVLKGAYHAVKWAPKVAGVAAGALAARGLFKRGRGKRESVEEAAKDFKLDADYLRKKMTVGHMITFLNQLNKAYDKAKPEEQKQIVALSEKIARGMVKGLPKG